MARAPMVKPLLLVGGSSTRMGFPKHLLLANDGNPAFFHTVQCIRDACLDADTVYVSVKDASQISDFAQLDDCRLRFLVDVDGQDIGPASGLLAAYNEDSKTNWLVIACDYPLIQPTTLMQLQDKFEPPVTCFKNDEGWYEPLLAIWGPDALRQLRDNVSLGLLSPSKVIHQLDAKSLTARCSDWLFNANSPEQWDTAMSRR